MLDGVDVSAFQGRIDWGLVAAAGFKFAFIKATEGPRIVDSCFVRNAHEARAAGLLIAPYHYGYPTQDPVAQAAHFRKTCDGLAAGPGILPQILDLESSKLGPVETMAWGRAFVEACEPLFDNVCAVYTYPDWWSRQVAVAGDHADWCRLRPLWLAKYNCTGPYLPKNNDWPLALRPWSEVTFWQWAGDPQKTHVPGIPVACDMDRFRGTEEELRAMCVPALCEVPVVDNQ